MLTAAPKGETAATVVLTAAEDALMRAAFGRYGGSAAARAKATEIVRRFETSGPGYWILCDCRCVAGRPPALVPVAESHIRRHELAGWPPHAVTCDFYREPAEQAEIRASFAPLKRDVRLVRSWSEGPSDILDSLRVASSHTGRPTLARLLVRLMGASGLQRIGAASERPPLVPEQVRAIWNVAGTIELDRGVKLADFLCTSIARIPDLVSRIAWASPAQFPRTRPHGVLLLRVSAVRLGELVPLSGPALSVLGRIAVPGEEPGADLDRDAPPPARAPYLALCLLARPAPAEPVRVLSAYVHPCASNTRLLLVDSNFERRTLEQLLSVQSWLARKRRIAVAINKPLEDLGPEPANGEPAHGPVIPDFIVTVRAKDGTAERRVVVETMGYADDGYRARKARMHALMSQAAGGAPVIEHDFHRPPDKDQGWRDARFWREVRWALTGAEHRVPEPPLRASGEELAGRDKPPDPFAGLRLHAR